MIEKFVTPNDSGIMGASDSESIQNAVDFASKKGLKVVIPRKNFRTGKAEWSIDKSILLPSHITIILDNCYVRQADDTFCNVFRNANAGIVGKDGAKSEQCDIKIIGEGYPILDGGKTNGYFEGRTGTDCGKSHQVSFEEIIESTQQRYKKIRGFIKSPFSLLSHSQNDTFIIS